MPKRMRWHSERRGEERIRKTLYLLNTDEAKVLYFMHAGIDPTIYLERQNIEDALLGLQRLGLVYLEFDGSWLVRDYGTRLVNFLRDVRSERAGLDWGSL